MKVAVLTKPNMQNHTVRTSVIDELNKCADIVSVICANASEIPDDVDKILVFGGDGTVLDAVRATGSKDIAILGVNLGNLGFLTAFEQDANPKEVVKALTGDECIDRMLLDVNVGENAFKALNEVVVKTIGTRPITLDVFVDGKFVDSYHSDGLIVSSPAGSTAYSLSAGGPVLAPDVDAIVINPICAHSLHSRPLVVSASSKVTVTVSGDNGATVSIDGGVNGVLAKGEKVSVTKSDDRAKFVSAGDENFYEKLLKKMNRWGTTLR